jgi:hypothetical protein
LDGASDCPGGLAETERGGAKQGGQQVPQTGDVPIVELHDGGLFSTLVSLQACKCVFRLKLQFLLIHD